MTVTGGPVSTTSSPDAVISFDVSDPTATLTCSLDATTPVSCTATDKAGNVETARTLNFIVLGVLDNFNRANSTTLNNGANWSQLIFLSAAAIRGVANPVVLVQVAWIRLA